MIAKMAGYAFGSNPPYALRATRYALRAELEEVHGDGVMAQGVVDRLGQS